MKSSALFTTAVLVFTGLTVLGFLNLGQKNFWASHAESRRADIARNMIKTGDYIVPRVNDKVILTKPPLYYWALAASFKINGKATEASARVPSAIAGVATAMVVFLIGFALFDSLTAVLAVAVLSTSYLFSFFLRFAELDMLFTFFITLSFYFLIRLYQNPDRPKKWGFCFWLSAALGFLVKGPFALLYPIGAFMLVLPFGKNRSSFAKSFFNLPGIAVFMIIVLPWFVYVYLYTGAGAIFAEEVAQRITDSRGKDHSPFFYLESLVNFSPWLIVLPFALFRAINLEIKRSGLILAWLIGGVVIASLISAKNHHYILPLYPAMALLTGRYVAVHLKGGLNDNYMLESITGWLGIFISFLVFLTLAILPFAPRFTTEVPPLYPYMNAGLVVVCAFLFATALRFYRGRNFTGLWISVITGLFITLIFAHAFVVPKLNSRNSHKNFLVNIRKIVDRQNPLRMYKIENFQTTFYLDRSAPALWNKNDLDKFVKTINQEDAKGYLITKKRFLVEALKISGGKTRMIDNYFIPHTASKGGNRFVLIEVDRGKKDKL